MKRFLTSGLVALLCVAQAFAGTVTGSVQNASGGSVANGVFSFTLTQGATISGTASIVASTVNCYTDANGNVVGEPNPLVLPVLSANTASGTLAAATYFARIAIFDGTGVTVASSEQTVILASNGTVIVTAPVKQPAGASGYNVYISTSTGTETLQGSVTGTPGSWANYSQSVPLVSGAALPASNSTSCKLHFNDEFQPSFVCYDVGLSSSTGNTIPGYPQYWYMSGGSAGTINIGQGTPQSNVCQGAGVFYPQAILTTPPFNATQSINGGLNLNGFPFQAGTGTFSVNVTAPNIPAGTIATTTPPTTTNCIPKFNGGPLTCSSISDNGTTVATAEDIAPCSLATASYIYVACQGSWAAALAACPTAGCILDGRASTTPRAIGTFDVGTKTVGIWLGPYLDFTAVQITMRSGLTMIGMGSGRGNTPEGTAITSIGSNGTPLFVIPQSNNVSAANLLFKGIHFIGATSNTSQEGFFTDASTLTNAGLWYSLFEDLYFTNFAGASIHLKAPATAGAVATNQFNTFINVTALRVSGGSLFSLNIDGPNGQNTFINSEFAGPFGGPLTGTNIRVGVNGVSTGTSQPYSNYFIGVTCQYGDVCATIEGSLDTRFINPHLEQLHGGWLCSQPTSAGNTGVSVVGGIVAGTVGVNSGSGYVVSGGNCNTSAIGWVMDGTTIQGTPDAIVINPGGIAPSASIRTLNLARTNFNGNYKAVHATGLTGTTGTQVLLTSPPTGIYQVCGYIQTTTAGNAVTGTLAFQYNNGSAQTITSSTIAINTANNEATIPCQQVFMAASQNLSYTGTVSAGVGAGVYRIDAEVTPVAQQ